MAARSMGSLSISFGLVSIPVKLFSATEASLAISFNLLLKGCGSRLKQQYLCLKENVPVGREAPSVSASLSALRSIARLAALRTRGSAHGDFGSHMSKKSR